jgi:concentrative nucleoside transporter, CNT family
LPLFPLLASPASEALSGLKEGGLDLSVPERAIGLVGIAAMILLAWLMSYDRKRFPWRLVLSGLALQALFGFLVLKTAPGLWFFERVGEIANGLLGFTVKGSGFVFGNLIQNDLPVGVPTAAGGLDTSSGLVARSASFFAFAALPAIIFLSSLTALLYHLGVMQRVVQGIAWVMQRTLKTSGAETLNASANIFLGQTEAPLFIKPFVPGLTQAELVTVMTSGFATAAIGVVVAYTVMLQSVFPGIAGHLLAASVMNAIASLYLAKVVLPETGVPASRDSLTIAVEKTDANAIDAAASGAALGLRLALNVAGMLIAFIALIAMLNFLLGWAGSFVGLPGLTIQGVLGAVLRPLAFVMGVPWADTAYVGGLIGVKTTLNEFVAYVQFADDLKGGALVLAPRSAIVVAYSLLGFANFSSIGIQIAGIGGLAPDRRSDFARFGLRAMIAGHLAAFVSACLAGMML